jgi:plasmid replication initiation protein
MSRWIVDNKARIGRGWLEGVGLVSTGSRMIRDLKARVLNPAIDQINAHSDLYVKWKQHKRGRVVHALTFTFGPKAGQKSEAKPQSPAKSAKPKLMRAYIEQHAQPGESWEEATERCRRQLEQESA